MRIFRGAEINQLSVLKDQFQKSQGWPLWRGQIIGYDYKIKYKKRPFNCSLQASHHQITYPFHPMCYTLYLKPAWRTRALETSLARKSKIILIFNLVLIVQSKGPYRVVVEDIQNSSSTIHTGNHFVIYSGVLVQPCNKRWAVTKSGTGAATWDAGLRNLRTLDVWTFGHVHSGMCGLREEWTGRCV